MNALFYTSENPIWHFLTCWPNPRPREVLGDLCWEASCSRYSFKAWNGGRRVECDNRDRISGQNAPREKKFLSEAKVGLTPNTLWLADDVGTNDAAKKEIIALFGDNVFDTPKPERLIQRIIHIASNPGDLVLDSFLGSGTTAAVAQKMGRRWIGIELGDQAYTHCKTRLDKVIDGEQGGISNEVNWHATSRICGKSLAGPIFFCLQEDSKAMISLY